FLPLSAAAQTGENAGSFTDAGEDAVDAKDRFHRRLADELCCALNVLCCITHRIERGLDRVAKDLSNSADEALYREEQKDCDSECDEEGDDSENAVDDDHHIAGVLE